MRLHLPIAAVGTALIFASMAALRPPQPESPVTVTLYLGTECPVSAAYTPRLKELAERYRGRPVEIRALFPQGSDDGTKLHDYVQERRYPFACELDLGGEAARNDQVKVVPTVIVRDKQGGLLYRGPFDDNKQRDLVRRSYVTDAVDAGLQGTVPKVKQAEAVGCLLQPAPIPAVSAVTFAEHVAPILNEHCLECHRPGQVAPFSMEKFEEVKNWSKMIALVTKNGTMPPWKAAPGIGEFQHENRLDDAEKETLQRWAEAGAPSGELGKAPAPPSFPEGWPLGEPDRVLKTAAAFKLGADGPDEYWNFVIKADNKEPVFIQAMDVRPGNRKVVHHVIAFLDNSGQARRKAEADPRGAYLTYGGLGFVPTGSLGGWAPGLKPTLTAPDTGIRLDPGTDIVLQVHYHKSGVEETDQTEIALYYNKQKVKNEVQIAWIANLFIRIPAGDPAKKFTQTLPIPVDVTLYWLMPHMHTLGQEMRATWVRPDGTEEPLIFIPKWDWNWQLAYYLKEPKLLPKGSKLRVEAVYDNSADNPFNPNNPPKDVTWGEATTDEMMLLVAGISVEGRLGQLARRFLRNVGGD
ncbi:MAG: ascorbate-dependent monooxygenase [Fimbriimonadaceae bacterium]|nr:ascorbate-dependent monooxygenase [Fimbriimonadaceae bacterium]